MIDRRYLPLARCDDDAMLSAGGATGPRVPPRVPVVTITARESRSTRRTQSRPVRRQSGLFPVGDKNTSSSFVKLSVGHTSADYLRASIAHEPTPWAMSVGGVGTIPAGAPRQ